MPNLQGSRQEVQAGGEVFPQGHGKDLKVYLPLVGEEVVGRVALKAEALAGCEIQLTNSTKHGGGVAEILQSLVPLMEGLGIRARWTGIWGPTSFFLISTDLPLSGASVRSVCLY